MSLFGRKSKIRTCFLCTQAVDADLEAHYTTHLIAVTDNNGNAAYTFKCPRCGLMDRAWGGQSSDPKSNARAGIILHLMERHHIDLP
jgi:hypothetical protein